MANIVKITDLPVATLPLSFTEVAAIVQNGVTKQVALQNLSALNVTNFSGTGVATQFALPGLTIENATNVYISGVYQQKNTYSISNNVITFSQAPPAGTTVEVMYA